MSSYPLESLGAWASFILRILPSWFVLLVAILATVETLVLALYLRHRDDHLILRPNDLIRFGLVLAFVSGHYALIFGGEEDLERATALSRVAWLLVFSSFMIIMAKYALKIAKYGQSNES